MDIHEFRTAVDERISESIVGFVLQWNDHPGILVVSGTLFTTNNSYYFLTAGHCLQCVAEHMNRLGKPNIAYLTPATTRSRIDFSPDVSVFRCIYDKDSTDIGIIALSRLYSIPLIQDGVKAVEVAPFETGEFQNYFIKGFHVQDQEKLSDGAIMVPVPMLVLTLEPEESNNRFCFSRSISKGVTINQQPLTTVQGLSGAIIFGAKQTGSESIEICPVAIQSTQLQRAEKLYATKLTEPLINRLLDLLSAS